MALDALVLTCDDNVATALRRLESGERVSIENDTDFALLQDIPFGHKFALRDIKSGDKIIKYGETIGQATAKIKIGEHVHVHNVEGLRGRGDKNEFHGLPES